MGLEPLEERGCSSAVIDSLEGKRRVSGFQKSYCFSCLSLLSSVNSFCVGYCSMWLLFSAKQQDAQEEIFLPLPPQKFLVSILVEIFSHIL